MSIEPDDLLLAIFTDLGEPMTNDHFVSTRAKDVEDITHVVEQNVLFRTVVGSSSGEIVLQKESDEDVDAERQNVDRIKLVIDIKILPSSLSKPENYDTNHHNCATDDVWGTEETFHFFRASAMYPLISSIKYGSSSDLNVTTLKLSAASNSRAKPPNVASRNEVAYPSVPSKSTISVLPSFTACA